MNELRKEYHNKTAGQIGEKPRDLQTSYFTDEYVFWLEDQLKQLRIGSVSNSKRDPMFNYYWDWTDFSVGFSIAKPNKCTGWNWYVSLDLTFLSVWVYF